MTRLIRPLHQPRLPKKAVGQLAAPGTHILQQGRHSDAQPGGLWNPSNVQGDDDRVVEPALGTIPTPAVENEDMFTWVGYPAPGIRFRLQFTVATAAGQFKVVGRVDPTQVILGDTTIVDTQQVDVNLDVTDSAAETGWIIRGGSAGIAAGSWTDITLTDEGPHSVPKWSTVILPTATAGVPYSHDLKQHVTGARIDSYRLVSGTLPAGIVVNSASGFLEGTTSQEGIFGSLVFGATNAAGEGTAAPTSLEVEAPPDPPSWGEFTLPGGNENQAYSYDVGQHAVNATSTSLAPTSDALPTGMQYGVTGPGILDGTPEVGQAGDYDLVFRATNADGDTDTPAKRLTVAALGAPQWTQAPTPPSGEVGTVYAGYDYKGDLADPSGVSFGWTGEPPGLSLSADGVVSGTPTGGGGTYSPVVTATNAGGPSVAPAHDIVIAAEVFRMRLESGAGYWAWETGDRIAWG